MNLESIPVYKGGKKMEKIRVLIAKPGLDGHDRGALVISQALRDHGMEVIYTGLRQSPAQIAQAAIQEDVDVIGVSSLSGAHNSLFPKIIDELNKRETSDIPLIGGGVIPSEDIPFLLKKGVKKVFTSGSSTDTLATYIKELLGYKDMTFVKTEPKKIAHIGIAVKSIEDSLAFYTDILNLELQAVENVESEAVKVAFLKIGESMIELLEPLNENSAIYKFIQNKGEGIHHIAFEVDHLEDRLKHYKQNGVQLIDSTPKIGANNSQVAFIHPKAANSVLFELCEHDKENE